MTFPALVSQRSLIMFSRAKVALSLGSVLLLAAACRAEVVIWRLDGVAAVADFYSLLPDAIRTGSASDLHTRPAPDSGAIGFTAYLTYDSSVARIPLLHPDGEEVGVAFEHGPEASQAGLTFNIGGYGFATNGESGSFRVGVSYPTTPENCNLLCNFDSYLLGTGNDSIDANFAYRTATSVGDAIQLRAERPMGPGPVLVTSLGDLDASFFENAVINLHGSTSVMVGNQLPPGFQIRGWVNSAVRVPEPSAIGSLPMLAVACLPTRRSKVR